MAARLEATPKTPVPSVIDLRHLRAEDLAPLLEEEIAAWRDLLDWDFSKSAELVERFVDMRSLSGCALLEDREVAGYAYYVLEDHKGLIGDLYVRAAFANAENENRLLQWVLEAMIGAPKITRIESQLMLAEMSEIRPIGRHLSLFERNFMTLDMEQMKLGAARQRSAGHIYYERWSEHYQEPAAHLIAAAYLGHVDSFINDQYRSVAGARRFLFNIVQYPGCGTFFKPASFAAYDRLSGRMCGISLASQVMPHCGHITQICVAPGVRGMGVGYELLRQSLTALRAAGCRKTSLTVTASNREAVQLYENVGFTTARKFFAYVWEGF